MPDTPKTYADICKAECEWCAKNITRHGGYGNHQMDSTGAFVPCTAPTRDQVIERQAADNARLAGTIQNIANVLKCEVEDIHRAIDSQAAEIERLKIASRRESNCFGLLAKAGISEIAPDGSPAGSDQMLEAFVRNYDRLRDKHSGQAAAIQKAREALAKMQHDISCDCDGERITVGTCVCPCYECDGDDHEKCENGGCELAECSCGLAAALAALDSACGGKHV